jgi:hypothetical protein
MHEKSNNASRKQAPSSDIVKKLFQLSGNKCTFPKCKKKLVDDDGYLRGEICSIESNERGQPHFNPKLSDDERLSFDNLILLCDRHHYKVDYNGKKYSDEDLKKIQEIKHESESLSLGENFEISDEIVEKAIKNFRDYQPFERIIIYKKDLENDKIPLGIKLKRELASSIGITICGKCGTRTKMKYAESIPDEMGNEWIGYAICPKCGNKEKWQYGDRQAG